MLALAEKLCKITITNLIIKQVGEAISFKQNMVYLVCHFHINSHCNYLDAFILITY